MRRRFYRALLYPGEGVMIVGDDAFVRAITEALELLKRQTPDVYALLQKHIGCVVSSKPARVSRHSAAASCATSLLAHFPTTVVLMRPYVRELPIEQRAGILAHETYHAELYRLAQSANPRQAVPETNAYSGEYAESLCVAYECKVLRRLGADEWEIYRTQRSLESKYWEAPGDGWLLPWKGP